jgi:hypothetical protein
MNTAVITFALDGTVHCLYSELIDLTDLGPLEVQRASNVEFKSTKQRWEVRGRNKRLLFSHRSRAICLAWEHQHFNR